MSQTRTSNLFIGEAIPHIWLRAKGNLWSLIMLGVCWVTKKELFCFQGNSRATLRLFTINIATSKSNSSAIMPF